MSKYIIDTETWANLFEVQRVGVYGIGNDIVANEKTVWSRMFRLDELEELNSDYINEHYGELQDTAYQRGINDGSLDVKQRVEGAYQAGLNDMWEAVKKIFGYEIDGALNIDELGEAFGYKKEDVFCTADIIRANTAEQAIAKLKAYEDKHSDRIEVGDEVVTETGKKYTVVSFGDGGTVCGFDKGGVWTGWIPAKVKKTGKHYDIQSILEAMRE